MDKHTFVSQVLEAEHALYRIAKSMLRNESDCEDAVQNAIVKAYEKQHTLRQPEFFKTWIIRILMNECYGLLRTRKGTVSYEEYFSPEHTQAAAPEGADFSQLYQALDRLKPKIKGVTVLHYIEGYSVEDIGALLKIPQGTVKSRLSKGRTQLKTLLVDMEDCNEQA